MSQTNLKERAAQLPHRPGAYLYKDARGRVLYVGKAKDLRHRVGSYFQAGRDQDPKTRLLLRQVADLDYIVTDSESEALLLELNLIKEHRPRYNIQLRDDKRYPFIKVTVKEPLPRAIVTRRVAADGNRYFGPYTDASAMRQTLRALQRAFGVRSCPLRLPRQRRARACLDYYIGRCSGPCVPHVEEADYARRVEALCAVLQGGGESLSRGMAARMQEAAAARRYEDAARLRDGLRALERVRAPQKVAIGEFGDRDVLAVAWGREEAVGVVLRIREGRLVGKDRFPLAPGIERDGPELASAFLKEYYRMGPAVPAEVLVERLPPDAEAIRAWLAGARGSAVKLLAPRRGRNAELVRLAQGNARLSLSEAAGAESQAAGLEELAEIAGLAAPPRRIECVDISASHGRDPVGSVVVFDDGRPARGEYRRYRVAYRGAGGESDDFAMMAEVVERRFRRLREEKRPLPDLLVVDGGRGHLSAARETLAGLGLERFPVMALAKREEEIYLEGRAEPLGLQPDAEALRVLVRLRNEAHRFAVTYHRKLRGRRVRSSALEGVPGLGPARRAALLRELGSVKRIAEATPEELRRVPGIGPALAREILRVLGPG